MRSTRLVLSVFVLLAVVSENFAAALPGGEATTSLPSPPLVTPSNTSSILKTEDILKNISIKSNSTSSPILTKGSSTIMSLSTPVTITPATTQAPTFVPTAIIPVSIATLCTSTSTRHAMTYAEFALTTTQIPPVDNNMFIPTTTQRMRGAMTPNPYLLPTTTTAGRQGKNKANGNLASHVNSYRKENNKNVQGGTKGLQHKKSVTKGKAKSAVKSIATQTKKQVTKSSNKNLIHVKIHKTKKRDRKKPVVIVVIKDGGKKTLKSNVPISVVKKG